MISEIQEALVSSFATIHSKDIRVDRVTLSESFYSQLVSEPDFKGFAPSTTVREVFGPYPPPQENPNKVRIGNLWGAEVFVGEKTEVFGENGHLPGWYQLNGLEDPEYIDHLKKQGVSIDGHRIKATIPFKITVGNLTIIVPSRSRPIHDIKNEEWTAIETLREMISETQYRKYIKEGFYCLKGASGKVYQIYREDWHVRVWEDGVMVEEICVGFYDTKTPPTDRVIALKTIIETDENEIRKLGNVYLMKKAA